MPLTFTESDFPAPLLGTPLDDEIRLSDEPEHYHALDGDDLVIGMGGDDLLEGGAGADTLVGAQGNDTLFGEDGDDVIGGNDGDDVIDAGAGNDTVLGGDDRDTVFGGDGDDYLDAGKDEDSIDGGAGNDTIVGRFGNDTLTGGEGADVFVFRPGHGSDLVTDFTPGEDVIDLTAYGDGSKIKITNRFGELTIETSDGDLYLFDGVKLGDLLEGDILL